jgi:hypothetical protein
MSEQTIVLLASLAVAAALAVLIYRSSRSQASVLAVVCELRRNLDQILAGTHNIEKTLKQHRRVLNDAHKQIHAVSKGLEKPTP